VSIMESQPEFSRSDKLVTGRRELCRIRQGLAAWDLESKGGRSVDLKGEGEGKRNLWLVSVS
jgi:hypothetical protein